MHRVLKQPPAGVLICDYRGEPLDITPFVGRKLKRADTRADGQVHVRVDVGIGVMGAMLCFRNADDYGRCIERFVRVRAAESTTGPHKGQKGGDGNKEQDRRTPGPSPDGAPQG